MIKEGMYSGEHYDFESAKAMLDELPKEATTEEIEFALLFIIREDYHEEVERFVSFDPTVDVNVDKPDEEIDDPTSNEVAASTHFSILLDASGSMNALSEGKKRIDLAKNA